ncbi:hypothetical protein ACFRCI_34150 [Streptomyces sp. NPDC056638]|uniref:hypothetical protein n=1 Tax=Streptomyces sp. NPDC056638 TaxID=3345887 RepID=UPI0036B0339B
MTDGLDAVPVGEAVAAARPDAVVHQMTGISTAHAGKPDLEHFDRWSSPPSGCAPRGRITCIWRRARGRSRQYASPKRPARLLAGEVVVTMTTEGRGFSNAKPKREPGRELRHPSWGQGFEEGPTSGAAA